MKKLLIVLIVAGVCMSSAFSQSRLNSLRCGQKIARPGDSKAYVVSICGNPKSQDVIAEERSGIKIVELVFEINGKLKIMTFRANRLTSIKDE